VTTRQLAALAIAGSALMPRRALASGPVLCGFRRLTGRPCPACGMTRSWHALSRGELREATVLHPFGPIAFAIASAAVVLPPSQLDALAARTRRWWLPLALAWVALWLYRLRGTADR
jgi:hypothetical protein